MFDIAIDKVLHSGERRFHLQLQWRSAHRRVVLLGGSGAGKTLTVRAEGNAPDHPYVQSVRWNGKPWSKNWIAHADLIGGGELVFEMGAKPSQFGTAKADRPPSFGSTPG